MLNSVAEGRRLAQRAMAWQAVAAVLVALPFLLKGAPWAIAAFTGAMAVAAGAFLSSWIALGGGVASADVAMFRLLAGVAVKWVVVVAVLALGIGVFHLPAVPLLAGVVTALLVQMLAMVRRR